MTEAAAPAASGFSEAVLQAAENAGLGVIVTRVVPRLEILYVSHRAAEILGATVEEVLACTPLDYLADVARDAAERHVAARHRGAPPARDFSTVVRRPNGTEIPVELGIAEVEVDGAMASVLFVRDVSERLRAEESLRRSEARLRTLIQTAPDGIVISRDRAIEFANPAAARLLGVEDASALVGRTCREFLHPDDFATMAKRLAQLRPGGGPLGPCEYRARTQDGRALVVEVTSSLFGDEENSVVGFARDVTESRRLQAQLIRADRLAALGTMAAGVAHEINNPLAFMALGIDTLERRLETEDLDRDSTAATLADLRHGIDRIAAIVRQLRAFSRAEATTNDGAEAVDLRTVVESASRMAAHELRQYARLEIDVSENLPRVRGNSTQLEQVLLNLLLNAAHALEEHQRRGRVRIVARAVPPGWVEVTVRDDGRGISPGDLKRIFDPFFTTKPVGTGTGLGLSICHSIVTGMGGSITAESEVGHGTSVHVRLPVLEPISPPSEPPDAIQRNPLGHRLRVVAVDDELAFLRAVKRLLASEHDVAIASDAEDAWELLREGPRPDLVLLDVMMPDLSGMDLFERIRTEAPDLVERVVFVTGGAARPWVEQFLSRVERPILRKPFDADGILRILERFSGRP